MQGDQVNEMKEVFHELDKDGSGICEVREIVQELRIEPSAEESRWHRTGIGRRFFRSVRQTKIIFEYIIRDHLPSLCL